MARRRRSPVLEYRRVQALLHAAFLRMGLARLCAVCPDCCCARFSFGQLVESADCTVLPIDVLPTVGNPSTPCCQLTATGCALPTDRRPWVCVGHVCQQWTVAMTDSQALELRQLFARLDAAYGHVEQAASTVAVLAHPFLANRPRSKQPGAAVQRALQ